MNRYKKVLLTIEVPDSDWCWEPIPPFRICEHFNNEGGYPECCIGIGMLTKAKDNNGIRKPKKCKELPTI